MSSSGRQYPLRDKILKAWTHLGLDYLPDANNGSPLGVAELVENRRDGLRQLTSTVYPLKGVQVLTNTLVSRILIDYGQQNKAATGIELADQRQFLLKARGEVILTAGAFRSPQLLMLSGVGDSTVLRSHGIEPKVHLPSVGKNFHDHLMTFRYWHLRHPEQGLAMGSPDLIDPAFEKGNPADWLATMSVPQAGLKAALLKDEGKPVDIDHVLLKGPRCHLEMNVLYAVFGSEQIGLQIPVDGKSIMTYYMGCLPTSRGTITLESKDPAKPPTINPNYFATETDRFVMREGWRVLSRLMLETPEGKELVADEILPEGHTCLRSDASDDQIDERIKIGGVSCHHPAGSVSMGTVVDGSLKVFGADYLRVADASVIPVPLAAHYQVPVFAIAEQAVDLILEARR